MLNNVRLAKLLILCSFLQFFFCVQCLQDLSGVQVFILRGYVVVNPSMV